MKKSQTQTVAMTKRKDIGWMAQRVLPLRFIKKWGGRNDGYFVDNVKKRADVCFVGGAWLFAGAV